MRGILLMALVLSSVPAWGLDKQGSAHGGTVAGDTTGFNVTGAFILGSALYNPSYAARPDNTGLTLLRYAVHADVDLLGRRLSIPLDVNLFSDGTQRGLRKLRPSEFEFISRCHGAHGGGRTVQAAEGARRWGPARWAASM